MTAGRKPAKAGSKQAGAGSVKRLKSGAPVDVGKATQFKKGQSGNPAGKAPGRLNLSTHIQNLLNDDDFQAWLPDAREGWKEFKGVPMKAIITTAITRAIAGDSKSMEWLAKYGYGSKVELTGADGAPLMPIALDATVLNRVQVDGSATQQPKIDSGQ